MQKFFFPFFHRQLEQIVHERQLVINRNLEKKGHAAGHADVVDIGLGEGESDQKRADAEDEEVEGVENEDDVVVGDGFDDGERESDEEE
jgi:hypothetical protein